MWNLTCFMDGTWKDIDYFDNFEEAVEFISRSTYQKETSAGWALINHASCEEYHADTLAELLLQIHN